MGEVIYREATPLCVEYELLRRAVAELLPELQDTLPWLQRDMTLAEATNGWVGALTQSTLMGLLAWAHQHEPAAAAPPSDNKSSGGDASPAASVLYSLLYPRRDCRAMQNGFERKLGWPRIVALLASVMCEAGHVTERAKQRLAKMRSDEAYLVFCKGRLSHQLVDRRAPDAAAAAAAAGTVADRRPFDAIAMFPTAAMINHSCRPNASHLSWLLPPSVATTTTTTSGEAKGAVKQDADHKLFAPPAGDPPCPAQAMLVLVANQPIARGTEITMAYVGLDLLTGSPAQRRDALGFACTCATCSGDDCFRPATHGGDAKTLLSQLVLGQISSPSGRAMLPFSPGLLEKLAQGGSAGILPALPAPTSDASPQQRSAQRAALYDALVQIFRERDRAATATSDATTSTAESEGRSAAAAAAVMPLTVEQARMFDDAYLIGRVLGAAPTAQQLSEARATSWADWSGAAGCALKKRLDKMLDQRKAKRQAAGAV